MSAMRRRSLVATFAAMAFGSGGVPQAAAAGHPPPFYSHGGQYTALRPPMTAPQTPITTAGGSVIDFASLHGKVVLLNFWATWCVPCVYEMPALDRLQAIHGQDVAVLPIAIDPAGKPAIRAFYKRLNLTHLGIFADPERQIGYSETANPGRGFLPIYALPITYIIDRTGAIRGYVPGPAQWDVPQAAALLSYLAQP